MKPLVSVIIPTLNEEATIEKCLKALSEQTKKRELYEIIVVDSSSEDNTANIASEFADRVIITAERKGAGPARNLGAKNAKAEMLAFVDGDTIVCDTSIEGIIETCKRCIACTGPFKAMKDDPFLHRVYFSTWSLGVHLFITLGIPLIPGFNFVVRKKFFELVGGFTEENKTVEDYELSLKLRKFGRIGFSRKMRVQTSARRLAEMGMLRYTLNGVRFFLFGKSYRWEEFRKDFRPKASV